MKIKRVHRYRNPGYPTRLEVLSHPDLLKRNLPPRWRSIPAMAGSVTLFLAANSLVRGADEKAALPGDPAAIVAPIFDHGEGRGATGCVVMSPPVFLSEEEAWQVIDQELAKRGVNLPESAQPLRGVQIPARTLEYKVENGKVQELIRNRGSSSTNSFSVDRGNSTNRILVEFVSEREYSKVGGPGSASTVKSYDFRETAKTLAQNVRQQAKDKVYFGVLYDPAAEPPTPQLADSQGKPVKDYVMRYRESMAAGRKESIRLLRLQVQDFLKWLEAQAAI